MLFAYRFYILCAYRPWHKSHIIQGFTIGFVLRKLMIAQQYKKTKIQKCEPTIMLY